jgi:hypothetical protein
VPRRRERGPDPFATRRSAAAFKAAEVGRRLADLLHIPLEGNLPPSTVEAVPSRLDIHASTTRASS